MDDGTETNPLLAPVGAVEAPPSHEKGPVAASWGLSRAEYAFYPVEWAIWVSSSYRQPLDTARADDFWYRSIVPGGGTKKDEAGGALGWLTDLYTVPNWAVCLNYFNVGIATSLTMTPVSYYLVEDLGATAAIVNTYSALLFLPWCLKVFYGALSDLVPCAGMYRRPYFVFGWVVFVASNAWLAMMAKPGVTALLMLSFAGAMGFMLSDVVADALILECSAFESLADKGRLRTHAYYVRQIGAVVGSLLGAVLYNGRDEGGTWGWGLSIAEIFGLQAALGLTALVFVPFMYELPVRRRAGLRDLCNETLTFVSNDGVWIPLTYLYVFNFCYIANPAWSNFLFISLDFTSLQFGLVATVGVFLSVLGLWAYERYFFYRAWRSLYLWTSLLIAFFSFLQIMLITGHTLGISKYLFVAGDTSLQQLLVFIPMCTMFFAMIPEGTEASVYAFLSTWQNVAAETSYQLGSRLTCYVNVTDRALERHKYRGMLKLTILVSCIQLLPVLGIYAETPGSRIKLVPNNIAETKAQCFPVRPNKCGATFVLALFVASIIFSLGQSVALALYPDSLCPGNDRK